MDLKMIMRLFSACVLIWAVAGQCPSPDNTGLNLEPDSSSAVVRSYPSIKREMSASTDESSRMFLDTLEKSNCADLRTIPGDNPDQTSRHTMSKSKPMFPVSLAQSTSACEPCPPTVRFLGRFYGVCYVIEPRAQQVRFVTCGKTCQQPCMCSRSYCQRTQYTKVWFLSYCTRSIGGFQSGFNLRFLWLPQDCKCMNY